jgi:phage terminase large subunit-like protein
MPKVKLIPGVGAEGSARAEAFKKKVAAKAIADHEEAKRLKEARKRGPYMTQAKREKIIHGALPPVQAQKADGAESNLDLQNAAKLAAELARRKKYRALDFYVPYAKQREFHSLETTKHEIALMAANRVGKTWSAGAAVAMHLTGQYAEDWPGRRFIKPIRAWAAGVTGLVVRDVNQRILCGTPGVEADQGSGMIPKECVRWKGGDVSTARGYSDAYDTVLVKHVTGGTSTISFKSYEQGRAKFQADTMDLIWCDEEPPMDIYSECLTRLATTQGLMLCTFTPLLGMSEVVMRYLNEPSDDRAWVGMTIEDAEHFSPEERTRIIAAYPPHEREARAKGIPMLGSGRIFQIAEEMIVEDRQNNPPHWFYGIALDFGITHPFAAVLMAWDRDSDAVHILNCIRMKDARPIDHAEAMKSWGQVRTFWPHDGSARDKGSGETLASQYKKHGVKMYPTHAHFPDGSISTEAAIMEMNERMTTGRLKVARSLEDWFGEFRLYHRKDGMIVQQNDDLLSATMKGIMMKRHFQQGALALEEQRTRPVQMCRDVDFDVFS